jgi:hypothetical protein
LVATSIGTLGSTTDLLVNVVGDISATVTPTTGTVNLVSGSPVHIGLIEGTGGTTAGDITIGTTSTIDRGIGAGTDINGGQVTFYATQIGSIGNGLVVQTTASPVLAGTPFILGGAAPVANTCSETGAPQCFVGATQLTNTINSLLSAIQAALTTEQTGPSELLSSGVLPENIFKSLGSQVLEIVGGAEGFGEGSESGEPVGVKIIVEEIGAIQESLEEKGVVEKDLVQELLDDITDWLDRLFGREDEKKKKK